MPVSVSEGWPDRALSSTVLALAGLADPQRAAAMSAYLRGQFPFLGIGTQPRRAALRLAWQPLPSPDEAELAAAVLALWQRPEREYQYAACDLLGRHRRACSAGMLTGTVERLITSRSWWDTVDSLRSVAVGPLVRAHPDLVPVMWRWLDSGQLWLVRSALIHQLGYAAQTDSERLFAMCARQASEREFFIAKAVGWALRTYARVAPDAVRGFVADHPELTPLARREALKHLG